MQQPSVSSGRWRSRTEWLSLAMPVVLLAAPSAVFAASAAAAGANQAAARPAGSSSGPAPGCVTPDVKDEPPCNPYLPDSPWGASHRNSYAQKSSPYPGLPAGRPALVQHLDLPGTPYQFQFTNFYRDGHRAAWASVVNVVDNRAVVKVDSQTGQLIDVYLPAERDPVPAPPSTGGISGGYNILDRDGNFFVPRQRFLDVYGDSTPGDRFSKIKLVKRFLLPERAFCRSTDRIVGATMTFDGSVALATEQGVTTVFPREPGRMVEANVRTASVNGAACADPTVADSDLETVSNSISADEDGGIYVVTSKQMRRVQWNPKPRRLTLSWSAGYQTEGTESAIRLGPGSGSTPAVMGTGQQRDRFVVISDNAKLMNMVLLWRDKIPADWKPIAPGKDRRIACEVPVRFGDPQAQASLSEQSVLVRGYATVHVQNLLRDESVFAQAPGLLRNLLAALEGGNPANAQPGVERIDWDPATRTCRTVWANTEVSIPNAIPSMSTKTNMVYGVGQRDGQWGAFGLDFTTGRTRLYAPATGTRCPGDYVAELGPVAAAVTPFLKRLPNSCENSLYAPTQIGPGGTIWQGTFLGVSIYRPTPGRG